MAGGVGAFAGMHFGNIAGMGNVFGGGCQKVNSIQFPRVHPQWTCGVESTGKWTCAGQIAATVATSWFLHAVPNTLHAVHALHACISLPLP